MINLSLYKNDVFGIFGLGITGKAGLISLINSGAVVYAWDDNADAVDELEDLYINNSSVKFF